jgi:endothelin-converting enzyme/putative endopeptidase
MMSAALRQPQFVPLGELRRPIGTQVDYSALRIACGDAVGNSQCASQFEFRRQLAKTGKPVDRNEWGVTSPTINAYYYYYYNPQMNTITFPSGILQPPFFDDKMDEAANLGAIGAVIWARVDARI